MSKFNKKLKLAEQGFTLVEVLVAIVIATIFIGVAMQMTVFAAIFKIKAQEYAEATTWIQEDLDNEVKYKADKLQFRQTTLAADAVPPASPALASTISINTPSTVNGSFSSFATNDTLRVGLDPTNYKITAVSGTGSTRTLTISPTLGKAQAANALVVATKMCSASSRTTGLADWLRDNVTDTNHSDGITDVTSNINTFTHPSLNSRRNQKQFRVSRTITLSDTSPYSVLEVFYSVAPTTAHTTLSTAASDTSTTLSVGAASGFKVGDKLTVGTDIDNTIASISGNTITLSSALGSAQLQGSIVDVSVATADTEVIPNVAFQCP